MAGRCLAGGEGFSDGIKQLEEQMLVFRDKATSGFCPIAGRVRRSFGDGEKSQSREALRGRGCRQELLSMNATSF